ncbi:protein wntless homolog isoform X2 [Xyrichtys novacula]|uniref:Protein wntless homolog isoform X2 n=1 Tax=Xyrichtys novacula TaxID=13765 RepID=A0AAV1GGD1_XYRNO|nr:protein wntless homolog isoform X2 [Xyrichtys novacula]
MVSDPIQTPSPTIAVHYLASKCVDMVKHRQGAKWFMPWGPNQCDKIRTFDEAMAKKIEANNIVFAVHMPMPNKEMSPWFQYMRVILQFDIAFKVYNQTEDEVMVYFDAGLAYRDDKVSEWTEMARSVEKRKLNCNFIAAKTVENEGRYYECDLLPFMEVGSVAHKYYLLNIRLPVNERKKINVGIGEIKDIRLVGIHQNQGFTKIWLSMKTILTPSILIIMIWYWRRITLMSRPPVLLEKVILALGLSMTFINIPVEWLSFCLNWTWMPLFGEIRMSIFYSTLLSFWIIFCGEHLVDQTERNRFSVYWKQVGSIVFVSLCYFLLNMYKRGVQHTNPFYSIWVSDEGTKLSVAFIIVAGTCACLYFFYLCYMVFRVICNISGRMSPLDMSKANPHTHHEGPVFRIRFLMLATLICAAMTVIFFIVSQVYESQLYWSNHWLQVNTAFFTGIYGMWNLYVFAIMFLYAPLHHNTDQKERVASGF